MGSASSSQVLLHIHEEPNAVLYFSAVLLAEDAVIRDAKNVVLPSCRYPNEADLIWAASWAHGMVTARPLPIRHPSWLVNRSQQHLEGQCLQTLGPVKKALHSHPAAAGGAEAGWRRAAHAGLGGQQLSAQLRRAAVHAVGHAAQQAQPPLPRVSASASYPRSGPQAIVGGMKLPLQPLPVPQSCNVIQESS